jgi:hypothetical protein
MIEKNSLSREDYQNQGIPLERDIVFRTFDKEAHGFRLQKRKRKKRKANKEKNEEDYVAKFSALTLSESLSVECLLPLSLSRIVCSLAFRESGPQRILGSNTKASSSITSLMASSAWLDWALRRSESIASPNGTFRDWREGERVRETMRRPVRWGRVTAIMSCFLTMRVK